MSKRPKLEDLTKVHVKEIIDGDTFITTHNDIIRLTAINCTELKTKTIVNGKRKWIYDPEQYSLEAKLELEKRDFF